MMKISGAVLLSVMFLIFLTGCSYAPERVSTSEIPDSAYMYSDGVYCVRFGVVDREIHFPQLNDWGGNDAFTNINHEIRDAVSYYETDLSDPYRTTVYIDYEITLESEKYWSIRFDGGSDNITHVSIGFALVFDMETGERLSLYDFVSDEDLTTMLNEQYYTDDCRIANPGLMELLPNAKSELRETLTDALSGEYDVIYTEGFYLTPDSIGLIADDTPKMREHILYEFKWAY